MKSFSSFSFFFFKFNTVSLFLRGSGLAQLAQASLLLAWEIFPSEFAAPGREVCLSKEIPPGIWNMSSLESGARSPCCTHRLVEGLQPRSKIQSLSFG